MGIIHPNRCKVTNNILNIRVFDYVFLSFSSSSSKYHLAY